MQKTEKLDLVSDLNLNKSRPFIIELAVIYVAPLLEVCEHNENIYKFKILNCFCKSTALMKRQRVEKKSKLRLSKGKELRKL